MCGGADAQGAIVIVVVVVCRFSYLNLPPDCTVNAVPTGTMLVHTVWGMPG